MIEQTKFFDDVEIEESKKKLKRCNFHHWITEDDFIEVEIKKTKKIVKRCWCCEKQKLNNKKIMAADRQKHKKDLTDWYVIQSLKKGKNGLKTDQIPEPLIEAKRAVLKLKHLTEKLEEPIKVCSIHGELYREEVIKSGKNISDTPRWRCRLCMRESHVKHYNKNKESIKIKHAQYRKECKEKVKETKHKSWLKHRHANLKRDNERRAKFKALNPEKYKAHYRKRVDELHDTYVKKMLINRTNLTREDISDSLIAAKRAVILLTRGAKKRKDENKILQLEEKINVKRSEKDQ